MAEHLSTEQRLGATRWAVDVLDSLIASGVIRDSDLDGLTPRELVHVAAEAVRYRYSGFDVQAARATVPERRIRKVAA